MTKEPVQLLNECCAFGGIGTERKAGEGREIPNHVRLIEIAGRHSSISPCVLYVQGSEKPLVASNPSEHLGRNPK